MVAEAAHGLNADIGADGGQLFAEEADVDLDVVLYGIGVEAPDARKQHLFGKIVALGLEQEAHDVKLLGGQAHALRAADEHTGGEIECGIAETKLVHLIALPPEQRTAVVLFYYEDLSLREIARTLRVPEGTVKSRLSRGRERLRTLLSEEASEKEDTT